MAIDVEAVRKAAGATRDPEVRRPIASMGLLDDVQVEGDRVTVHYHLTSPLCPTKFATQIGREIRRRVEAVPGVGSCEVVLRDHYQRDRIQGLVNPPIPLRRVP
ncbi:MAG: iron-sulfur cluster assembly protein [Chloroflexi bacterium]|nr:iron-sulfur cluster assembly protein [Chloroflexota bacterium]